MQVIRNRVLSVAAAKYTGPNGPGLLIAAPPRHHLHHHHIFSSLPALSSALFSHTSSQTSSIHSNRRAHPPPPARMSDSAEKPRARVRPDFKVVEASRPPFEESKPTLFTKTVDPDWKFGDGANRLHTEKNASQPYLVLDPSNHDRPAGSIYKLLISGVTPRPIAFVSSVSADGKTHNLAPFSYFTVVAHDPPIFALGVTGDPANPKDTLKNLVESRECVINIISEHYVEAANAGSVDAPYGASEWDVSGLTPDYSTETVAAPRVKEAIFSIEAKVESIRGFESRIRPGTKNTTVVLLEASRLWIREDALDPEDQNIINPAVLRPISRLGGISYGRTTDILEIPRPQFEKDLGGQEGFNKLKKTPTQNKAASQNGTAN